MLHEELKADGLKVQVVCPGIVATEFHERQGLDLSALPRMSAGDVVTHTGMARHWSIAPTGDGEEESPSLPWSELAPKQSKRWRGLRTSETSS